MTEREKAFFIHGIQHAAGKLDPQLGLDVSFIALALKALSALRLDGAILEATRDELFRDLDAGGYRGAEMQRRAKQ